MSGKEQKKMLLLLTNSHIKVIVFQLDFRATGALLGVIIVKERNNIFIEGKVWIATTLSKLSIRMLSNYFDLQHKQVLFSFQTQTNRRQYSNFDTYSHPGKRFVEEAFLCSHSRPLLSKKVWRRCTEKENWALPPLDVPDRMIIEDGSGISRAIHVVASVLNAASSSQLSKRRMLVGDHQSPQIVQPWQEFVEFNYYKPGDYLITGITSKIIAAFYPHDFSQAPIHRLRSHIKVIVFQLDFRATGALLGVIIVKERNNIFIEGKVWIATTLSKLSIRMLSNYFDLQHKQVLFSFQTQTNRRQYSNFDTYSHPGKRFVEEAFLCSHSRPLLSKKVWRRCTEKENWALPPLDVPDRMIIEDGSGISRAIHVVASVLNAASSSQLSKRRMLVGDHQSPQIVQPWQ
ncbi:hypothetical protein L345_16059, partial [Ophiophagus hannah]